MTSPHPVRPGTRGLLRLDSAKVDLDGIDPRSTPGMPTSKAVRSDPKSWARGELTAVGAQLAGLQERLYAEQKGGGRRRLLIVLQAMDCGGKDGAIRRVAGTMNPLGLRVVGFGPPTPEERRHHFLWRIRRALPGPGVIGVFNRSHYEDVLIARVRGLVPRETWSKRYDEINRFEATQARDGLTLVKVMLHISREEQAERLAARLTDPTKRWKYHPDDLAERARWDDYQEAYQAALGRCSTEAAPWYVIPADRKWYRDWAMAHLIWETLEDLDPQFPKVDFDPDEELRKLRATT